MHESPEKSDSCTVQVLGLILELLSFFVEHHTYHIKNYILNKGNILIINVYPLQLISSRPLEKDSDLDQVPTHFPQALCPQVHEEDHRTEG